MGESVCCLLASLSRILPEVQFLNVRLFFLFVCLFVCLFYLDMPSCGRW